VGGGPKRRGRRTFARNYQKPTTNRYEKTSRLSSGSRKLRHETTKTDGRRPPGKSEKDLRKQQKGGEEKEICTLDGGGGDFKNVPSVG